MTAGEAVQDEPAFEGRTCAVDFAALVGSSAAAAFSGFCLRPPRASTLPLGVDLLPAAVGATTSHPPHAQGGDNPAEQAMLNPLAKGLVTQG